MKKNNKKGFTLIELLAVLVVLAILALIAIPIVIKVINNAREDSYKRSVEGYARTVELGYARWAMANPGIALSEDSMEIKNTLKEYIETKGDQVDCEQISFDEKGQVILGKCLIYKQGEDVTTSKPKSKYYYKYETGKVDRDGEYQEETSNPEPEPITYEAYSIGDIFTFGGASYHVIAPSDESQDYVVALKDEPLTVEEVTALGFTPSYTYTGTTKQWAGMYYDNTSPYSTDYDTSDIKPLVDAWSNQYASKLSEVNGYKARLIKFEELINNLGYDETTWNGTEIRVDSSITPSWVYNNEYWYWTMSQFQDSASNVWYVCYGGSLDGDGNYVSSGVVRPVINVLKSAITKTQD